METDKPQISILMAIYEPRMDWLREQLLSLDAQTYPNLKLYIRDDCSPTVPYMDICACVQECIRKIPFEIVRNEENLGSNKTFERLTDEADGAYFAYCDQDDIWLPEKLATLQKALDDSNAGLVCSDMYVIDENGKQTANSITKVRRHHVFRSGSGLAKDLLVSNFVTGCTVLMPASIARAAIPFCPYMVHDQYLALCAAQAGDLLSLPQPLIRYRIHSSNQTLSMAGVGSKRDYIEKRVSILVQRLRWLLDFFPAMDQGLCADVSHALLWAEARVSNLNGHPRSKKTIWKYRRFGPLTSVFEIVMSSFPESLFMFVVELKRKNIL